MPNSKEYVEKMKARLDEWKLEIDRLEEKTAQMVVGAKAKYQQQIAELKKKREEGEKSWNRSEPQVRTNGDLSKTKWITHGRRSKMPSIHSNPTTRRITKRRLIDDHC